MMSNSFRNPNRIAPSDVEDDNENEIRDEDLSFPPYLLNAWEIKSSTTTYSIVKQVGQVKNTNKREVVLLFSKYCNFIYCVGSIWSSISRYRYNKTTSCSHKDYS